jgi:hypothetical protein
MGVCTILGKMLLRTKIEIKPISETNVGANLMFALRTKTGLKPMFENELETFASGIGSQTIVVRSANIRFAPTLFSDIGWISITTIYPKIYDRLLIHKYVDFFSKYFYQNKQLLLSYKKLDSKNL